MTADVLLRDLLNWSLQIMALTVIAALFTYAARLRMPGGKLLYWQSVLTAFLALPAFRPWHRPVVAGTWQFVHAAIRPAAASPSQNHFSITSPDTIAWALLAGICIRLAMIGAGCFRLRRYRQHARPVTGLCGSSIEAWRAEAALLMSDGIGSPVTFGFRNPVILLPGNFTTLDEAAQNAVLCHEILHVRRGDWLFTFAEEVIRALFWFHPALWWTLGEIQLAREQTVDQAVIEMMKCRDQYVDALLTIAGAAGGLDVAPASLFLRRRHLKQRVVSILKEVRMSQKRTLSTLAAGLALIAGSCWLITGALPLEGAPQIVADAPGVSVEVNGAQLMHRAPVPYSSDALQKGIGGSVVVQVKTDAAGNVIDASILSGPDEFRKAVLQSVLSWHFTKDSAQTTRQIIVNFTLPKGAILPAAIPAATVRIPPPPPAPAAVAQTTITQITVNGLSDQTRDELLKTLPVHEGDVLTLGELSKLVAAVRSFDEHLNVRIGGTSQSEQTITISAPNQQNVTQPAAALSATQPHPIRVGGQVAAAGLLSQVVPVYPPSAKSARVQGKVQFEAVIAQDGSIKDLKLLSGPPLLVEAAMQAVQQWTYRPTLLNGQPVEVLTTIDVNFTLSE